MSFVFSRLSTLHKRTDFRCGEPALDAYVQKYARQDAKKGYATVIVASPANAPEIIVGYYTLAATSVGLELLPEETVAKLPRYGDVPAVLLGRLAVCTSHQGQHLGTYLLFDAMRRCLGNELAWALFFVQAKNARARAFYTRFQFTPFIDNTLNLWMCRKQLALIARQ